MTLAYCIYKHVDLQFFESVYVLSFLLIEKDVILPHLFLNSFSWIVKVLGLFKVNSLPQVWEVSFLLALDNSTECEVCEFTVV